jgi:hypothetical protein
MPGGIIPYLKSDNGWTRQAAAHALGKIGDVRAVTPLINNILSHAPSDIDMPSAGAAFGALETIIKNNASNLSREDIEKILNLKSNICYITEHTGDHPGPVLHKFDIDHLKELVKKELRKRDNNSK